MPLQVRNKESGDPRFVDPNRDLAHNFPRFAGLVAATLDRDAGPSFKAYCEKFNVTEDELLQVMEAWGNYVHGVLQYPNERIVECMERTGLLACRPEAMFACNAVLGNHIVSSIFQYRREAQHGLCPYTGKPSLEPPCGMNPSARRFRILMNLPPWKRAIYLQWRRVVKLYRGLRNLFRKSQ